MSAVLTKSIYRTHTCGELTSSNLNAEVKLSGWIHRIRDHGGIIFIDLRDNYGLTQVVFAGDKRATAQNLRVESVIQITGKVIARAPEAVNTKLPTGGIEVSCATVDVLSEADVVPFQIAEADNAPEAMRLKYRFLELRRLKLHNNILLRSQVIFAMRKIMHDLGFNEFQTPILTSSSPEGARDFIVPSRHHPGRFFALPQAPQQFKQLLMVSGFDRYFQIAPCFRDEDPRTDRSPGEFYQLDLEMSFVEQEDVFNVAEQLMHRLFTQISTRPVTKLPFPRIRYDDSLAWYGNDKPDLRVENKIEDITEIFQNTEFKVFRAALSEAGRIRTIAYAVPQPPSRKFFDDTLGNFQQVHGLGLAYLTIEKGELKGNIAKFLTSGERDAILARYPSPNGATVLFIAAGRDKKILGPFGKLRVEVGQALNLSKKDEFRFCFITDYPMYELDEQSGQIVFSHNPFSMPQGGLEALQTKDPLTIYAYQYDLVCNGVEFSSGAIRNHTPEIMYKAFEIAGYSHDDVDSKFGGMIRAFKFGAPPHGGMAPGVDRIVMILADEPTIREVIAFPMAQTVEDLMMGAPNTVSDKQLREAHIKLDLPPV
jgi:aspartyl-tRNA synthetase